ncbi:MAG: gamma-glutamyltransferase [Candidatus Competibacterales bacterium]
MHPLAALETWTVTKPAVAGRRGLVASQHYRASQVGAEVLAAGGNAVDAAVATALALAPLEPWMSGLGGGGFMLVYKAAERRAWCVDFSMVAPLGLDPGDYPLTGEVDRELFGWPAVEGQRNLQGYTSAIVPGQVAGLALALDHFGSRPWAELVAPAVALAREGLQVDWYATLKIAAAAKTLARYEASKAVYLPDGFVPAGQWGGPLPRLDLGNLAATLEQLARRGPGDFYRGDIARALVADLERGGSCMVAEDLARYEAKVVAAGAMAYRDHRIHYAPGLSAGPTLHHALELLADRSTPAPKAPLDGEILGHFAQCLLDAFAHRLAHAGDEGADRSREPGCTTHISAVDGDGNLVALTQTLLSVFGSKVVLPQTGILLNNGVMWFDPRPARPNSMGPGKRPLTNMCPAILERADGFNVALGASGGRRIMPAVFQLLALLTDRQLDLEAAFHTPRLDASGTSLVTVDAQVPQGARAQLAQRFESVTTAVHGVYPNLFACPNAVGWQVDGSQRGAAFVPSPWAAVVGPDTPALA